MKVLIVEDDRVSRYIIEASLLDAGLDVIGTESAEDALTTLEATQEIKLIICDIGLPGMSGLELLQYLKQNYDVKQAIPVVIVTGHVSNAEKQKVIDQGAMAVFSKPVNLEYLTKVVHNYIGN